MKMSDVFSLPLEYAGLMYLDQKNRVYGTGDFGMDSAAAHAINQHDALTQLNKELVEALERVITTQSGDPDDGYYMVNIAENAIKRAKELAE